MSSHAPATERGLSNQEQTLLRGLPAEARRVLIVAESSALNATISATCPRCEYTRTSGESLFEKSFHEPFDAILFAEDVRRIARPLPLLERLRSLLAPTGQLLISVPNLQHHAVITALLRGDFQYSSAELNEAGPQRFFTYASFVKLLLDAGFAPQLVDVAVESAPAGWVERFNNRALGVNAAQFHFEADVTDYCFSARPLPAIDPSTNVAPMTFVACIADEQVARDNLLSSPCLQSGSPHQLLLMRGCRSAAEGLNAGIEQALHELVVCVHQDVYLPTDWPARLQRQWQLAQQLPGGCAVAGMYGLTTANASRVPEKAGHVVDRQKLLRKPVPLPAPASVLDELLLVLPRTTPLRFDSDLGFHVYGTDICHRARAAGLQAVILDALCFHHCRLGEIPREWAVSAQIFARKWPAAIPLETLVGRIDAETKPDQVSQLRLFKGWWRRLKDFSAALLPGRKNSLARHERLWKQKTKRKRAG